MLIAIPLLGAAIILGALYYFNSDHYRFKRMTRDMQRMMRNGAGRG